MIHAKLALALTMCLLLTACDSAENETQTETATQTETTTASAPAGSADADGLGCVVTTEGIDKVKLGMTLDAARKALPGSTFSRTSDGEGIAYVEAKTGTESIMRIYAGEEDPAAPIAWNRSIEQLESFHPTCHTAAGIHPGSLISDAEKAYGKTKTIFKSEIEQRESISFEKLPAGLGMRIDSSGIFKEGSNETTQFRPDGKILNLIVSAPPAQ